MIWTSRQLQLLVRLGMRCFLEEVDEMGCFLEEGENLEEVENLEEDLEV